eukprot:scaffold9726_cov119-Isochrysis_galbana.AAC.37
MSEASPSSSVNDLTDGASSGTLMWYVSRSRSARGGGVSGSGSVSGCGPQAQCSGEIAADGSLQRTSTGGLSATAGVASCVAASSGVRGTGLCVVGPVALDSRAIRVRHMQHLRPHGAQGAPPVPSGRTGRAACAAALALRAIVGGQVPSPPDRGELAGLGVLLAAGLMVERRRRRCQLLVGFKARLAHNDAGQVVASRPRASGGALGQDLKGRTIEAQPERGVGVDVEAGRANAQPADDEGRIGGLADVGGLGAREAAGARRRLGTEMYRRLCRLRVRLIFRRGRQPRVPRAGSRPLIDISHQGADHSGGEGGDEDVGVQLDNGALVGEAGRGHSKLRDAAGAGRRAEQRHREVGEVDIDCHLADVGAVVARLRAEHHLAGGGISVVERQREPQQRHVQLQARSRRAGRLGRLNRHHVLDQLRLPVRVASHRPPLGLHHGVDDPRDARPRRRHVRDQQLQAFQHAVSDCREQGGQLHLDVPCGGRGGGARRHVPQRSTWPDVDRDGRQAKSLQRLSDRRAETPVMPPLAPTEPPSAAARGRRACLLLRESAAASLDTPG